MASNIKMTVEGNTTTYDKKGIQTGGDKYYKGSDVQIGVSAGYASAKCNGDTLGVPHQVLAEELGTVDMAVSNGKVKTFFTGGTLAEKTLEELGISTGGGASGPMTFTATQAYDRFADTNGVLPAINAALGTDGKSLAVCNATAYQSGVVTGTTYHRLLFAVVTYIGGNYASTCLRVKTEGTSTVETITSTAGFDVKTLEGDVFTVALLE